MIYLWSFGMEYSLLMILWPVAQSHQLRKFTFLQTKLLSENIHSATDSTFYLCSFYSDPNHYVWKYEKIYENENKKKISFPLFCFILLQHYKWCYCFLGFSNVVSSIKFLYTTKCLKEEKLHREASKKKLEREKRTKKLINDIWLK